MKKRPLRETGGIAFFHLALAPRKIFYAGACTLLLGCAGFSSEKAESPVVHEVNRFNPSGAAELTMARAIERPMGGGASAEICFNGLDDNSNRLIDEGCGVHQGQVQIMLAWPHPSADIDLYVSSPDGQIAQENQSTSSGLVYSADCPGEGKCDGQNFENVYLEELETISGRYSVRVRLEKMPHERSVLRANLGVRLPGRTRAFDLEFFAEGQEILLNFDVASDEKKE